MDDFNTFVETWVVDAFPDMERALYPIGGSTLAIIGNEEALMLKNKLEVYGSYFFTTTVEGTRVLVSSLWVNVDLLEAVSSTEAKRNPRYTALLDGISGVRLSMEDRKRILLLDDPVAGIPPVENINPTPEPVEEKPFELFSNRYLTFGDKEFFIDNCSREFGFHQEAFLELSRRLKKPVIVLTQTNYQIKEKEFFENAFKIIFINDQIQGFRKVMCDESTMCLGFRLTHHYMPIPKEKSQSPYANYDIILKDNFSNVIFAVGKNDKVVILTRDNVILNLVEVCRRCGVDADFTQYDMDAYKRATLQNKNNYVKIAKESSEIVIRELKSKSVKLQAEYVEAMDMALTKAKMLNNIEEHIRCFDQDKFDKDLQAKYDECYAMVEALDRVQSIIIKDDGTVLIYTKEIYSQDERTKKWHEIGTFQITIGMHMEKYDISNTVRIKNTKYGTQYTGYHAPHVFAQGYMCHGNIESMIIDAYKNKNLYELVFIILRFLQSANTSDEAGRRMDEWPEVSEEVAKGIKKEEPKVEKPKVDIPIHIGGR